MPGASSRSADHTAPGSANGKPAPDGQPETAAVWKKIIEEVRDGLLRGYRVSGDLLRRHGALAVPDTLLPQLLRNRDRFSIRNSHCRLSMDVKPIQRSRAAQ